MGAIENKERRDGQQRYGKEYSGDLSKELADDITELKRLVGLMEKKTRETSNQLSVFND